MIPLAKPSLGQAEAQAAGETILSGWVTQGPKVRAFEEAFAEIVGAAHATAVSSCTTALHLAFLAVGVKPGDLVITVSHSFIATANAVRICGAEPIFVDIDPETYNMDPRGLERFLQERCEVREDEVFFEEASALAVGESPLAFLGGRRYGRVAAICPVHQIGIPADLGRILPIARRYGLPVVEDAACAIGSEARYGDAFEPIGKPHGDVACFSFHPRKVITTGDGGMITTNNPEYDQTFRLLRQHGMSVTDTARHGAARVIIEEYVTTAYNYRMTDIQAAVGIEQLKRLPNMVERRREIAQQYADTLSTIPWLETLKEPEYAKTNWQSYPVRLTSDAPATQKELMHHLLTQGVASKPGVMNAHAEAPYRPQGWNLPESEKARAEVVLLPFYDSLTEVELQKVVDALTSVR